MLEQVGAGHVALNCSIQPLCMATCHPMEYTMRIFLIAARLARITLAAVPTYLLHI